jgi:hypothetical protein
MRVVGLVLSGALAAAAPLAAHAAPPGAETGRVGAAPAPGIAQARDGNSPGWQAPPGTWGRGGHQTPGHPRPSHGGSVPPHRGPFGPAVGWGPWPGVPTYWVWGPSGGAFDYPFADWRDPTGGWGNP